MHRLVPERVYFEPGALNYDLSRKLLEEFQGLGIPILTTTCHNRATGLPGDSAREAFFVGALITSDVRSTDRSASSLSSTP